MSEETTLVERPVRRAKASRGNKRIVRRQLQPGEELLPAHQKFIEGIALEGLSNAASYRKYIAERGTKMESIWSVSSTLATRYASRILAIRNSVKDFLGDQLNFRVETLAQYLVEGIETPIGEITEDHRLAQEMTVEVQGGRRGRLKRGQADEGNEDESPPVEVVKIKMLPKSEAIKHLLAITGWAAAQKVEVGASDDLKDFLERVRRPGMPREVGPGVEKLAEGE